MMEYLYVRIEAIYWRIWECQVYKMYFFRFLSGILNVVYIGVTYAWLRLWSHNNCETDCISVYALDAKMRFDDNAEFRQKDIFDERDWSQEDPKEVEASRYNLNYIALDGQ